MASHKVCLTLTLLWATANANFYNDRFESMARLRPWTTANDDVRQDFASSEYSPTYSSFTENKKRHSMFDSSESFDGPREFLSASKRIPVEDKRYKKVISPFYTITDRDSKKYRDVVMKSGVPYCQEMKSKRADDNAKDSTVCFKCKNPKTGATYEQCSFVSQPLTDSSAVDGVVATHPGYRNRRSNSEDSYRKRGSPYRFNEKLFSESSQDVPSRYKSDDEKCEKVVRDSMVCMVCRDTKSNGKYEQCSYVRQPKEKTYAYSKSSSFKNPQRREDQEDHEPEKSDREYSESKPVREESSSNEKYRQREEPESRSQKASKESSDNCKEVVKDSKVCTVCKDPDTGGNYEKCSYSYQPNDKVYKFSRSKSFGHPEESSSKESPSYGDESSGKSTESDDYTKDYTVPESYYAKREPPKMSSYYEEEPSSGYRQAPAKEQKQSKSDRGYSDYERSKSESQRIAESIEPDNCKEVEKDSMTCKVCKDPKTGTNSEQCSYKYQPNEKQYSYSKSRSFGTPKDSGDESHDASEKKEQREPSYKDQTYSFSADSDNKREFRETDGSKDSETEAKEESTTKAIPKKVDGDFYDAFKKKAEIQKFLQEFQKEDRSNCKKLMRDKMTCYECVDEKGFQKEECAFIGADEPAESKEEKESQEEPSRKVPRSAKMEDYQVDQPLDPEASATENVQVKQETSKAESSEEKEQSKEADPYEYVAETRPVFDKVLGFTLPAYMLSASEHEEEFDRVLSSRV